MSEISIRKASHSQYSDVAEFYEKCGYSRGVRGVDTVLIAVRRDVLVGAVRLCSEHGVLVLRGMQVLPTFQRQGIGSRLLRECLPILGDSTCYCIPWAHLEQFYGMGGFNRCDPTEAPGFLEDRLTSYLTDGLDVVLMRRHKHRT